MNPHSIRQRAALILIFLFARTATAVIAPQGSVTQTRRPVFQWDAMAPATWYQVYVQRNGVKAYDQWVQGVTTWTPGADLSAGTYQWWIRGWSPAGFQNWSTAYTFSLPLRLPGTPVPTSPLGVQSQTQLAYTWPVVPNATWFRLYIQENGVKMHDQWYPASTTTANSVTVSGHKSAASYQWWVLGWGPDGEGPWSSTAQFSMADLSPAKPTAISPNNTSLTERRPPFRWNAASRASWYRLYVDTAQSGAKVLDQWTQSTQITPAADLPIGALRWWVASWNEASRREVWSDAFSVTVTPVPPAGMAYIPAGEFQMGDTFGDGSTDELPVHAVYTSAYFMDKTEVTKAKWDEVYAYAIARGYRFSTTAAAKGANYPVTNISWLDALRWCNARSEQDGRSITYYVHDINRNWIPWKNQTFSADIVLIHWTSGGYRLPTEAEWEKAARGGQAGLRFPWGNTITHTQANYWSSSSYSYDTSRTRGGHPSFDGTSPAGYFAPNPYGLYDMVGNVSEYCWDQYFPQFYLTSPYANPRDPPKLTLGTTVLDDWSTHIVKRGSSWYYIANANNYAYGARNAARGADMRFTSTPDTGFRCVLSQ